MDSMKKVLGSKREAHAVGMSSYNVTLQRRGTTGSIGVPNFQQRSSITNNYFQANRVINLKKSDSSLPLGMVPKLFQKNTKIRKRTTKKKYLHSMRDVSTRQALLSENLAATKTLNRIWNERTQGPAFSGHESKRIQSAFRRSLASKRAPASAENSVVVIGSLHVLGPFIEEILGQNKEIVSIFSLNDSEAGHSILLRRPRVSAPSLAGFNNYELSEVKKLSIRPLTDLEKYLKENLLFHPQCVVIALEETSDVVENLLCLCDTLCFKEIFYISKGKLLRLQKGNRTSFAFSFCDLSMKPKLAGNMNISFMRARDLLNIYFTFSNAVPLVPKRLENIDPSKNYAAERKNFIRSRYSESELELDSRTLLSEVGSSSKKSKNQFFQKFVVKESSLQLLDRGCNQELIGLGEIYEQVKELVISKDEYRFNSLLMFGPPGCGKTSIIFNVIKNFVSNSVTFLLVPCSELFPRRLEKHDANFKFDLKDLFLFAEARGKESGKSVIFLESLDEICKSRRRKVELVHNLSLLSSAFQNIIVIGLTTTPWEIDLNLFRYFERKIAVPLPDQATRQQIISMKITKAFSAYSEHFQTQFAVEKLEAVATDVKLFSTFDLNLLVKNAVILYRNKKGVTEELDVVKLFSCLASSVRKAHPTVSVEIARLYNRFLERFGEKDCPSLITDDPLDSPSQFSLFA